MQHLQKTGGGGPPFYKACLPIPILELTSPLHIRLYFQSLPRCPFFKSFIFTFMHGMGGYGGAPSVPTFKRSISNDPSGYPLSFQTPTHSSPPRPHLNSFAINPLRTLFTTPEGVPPLVSLLPYFFTSLLPYFISSSAPLGQGTTCPFPGLPTSIAGQKGVVF